MKRKNLVLVFFGLLFVMTGCGKTHFGVRDKALIVPDDVAQTEQAIADAEKAAGAKYCPEKITKAKELAKQAMETFWACHDAKAKEMLAQARSLASEAKACKPPVAAAAPAAVVPPPPVRQPVSFHTVYFDFMKSDLTASTKTELDKAAKIMTDNPDLVLELQGNTCNMGPADFNLKLGERRAKSVFAYLTGKGINANRLKTVSYGLTKPVAPNTTKEGRSKNRRVDMVTINLVAPK
jgi:outer membrane protein OmpA-like peptidoglycan-associated protein